MECGDLFPPVPSQTYEPTGSRSEPHLLSHRYWWAGTGHSRPRPSQRPQDQVRDPKGASVPLNDHPTIHRLGIWPLQDPTASCAQRLPVPVSSSPSIQARWGSAVL